MKDSENECITKTINCISRDTFETNFVVCKRKEPFDFVTDVLSLDSTITNADVLFYPEQ